MIKQRAKYGAMLAGASAPIYLLIQLVFGADVGPSLVRTLWFVLIVFLVSLALNWEGKRKSSPPEEPPPPQS